MIMTKNNNKKIMKKLLLLCFLSLFASEAQASGLILDSTFNQSGQLLWYQGYGQNSVTATAVDQNGNIFAAGCNHSSNGTYHHTTPFITRFNPSGHFEASYPVNVQGEGCVRALAVDSSNRLLAAAGIYSVGNFGEKTSESDFVLIRYLSNGSVDLGFSQSGFVRTDIHGGDDKPNSIFIQSDGKIILLGKAEQGEKISFALARYLTSGALDTSFGDGDGTVVTDLGAQSFEATSALETTGGHIFVAGRAYDFSNSGFVVVKYTKNGSLDSSFGAGGISPITYYQTGSKKAPAMVLLPDGDIKLWGCLGNKVLSADYDSSGNLAESFSYAWSDSESSFNGCGSIHVNNNEVIGLGASIKDDNRKVFAVASFGSGFSPPIAIETPFEAGDSLAHYAAFQADGKVIILGNSEDNTGEDHVALARYSRPSNAKLGPVSNQPIKKIVVAGNNPQVNSAVNAGSALKENLGQLSLKPNLVVSLSSSVSTLKKNTPFNLTATIKNIGSSPATNSVLVQTLLNLNNIDIVSNGGCVVNNNFLTCSLGTIGINQTVTKNFTIKPKKDGVLPLEAKVSTAGESDMSNNSSKVSVTVTQ